VADYGKVAQDGVLALHQVVAGERGHEGKHDEDEDHLTASQRKTID
jgi:hypothetical protein